MQKAVYPGRSIAVRYVGADFGPPEYIHAIRVGSSSNVGYGSPGSMTSTVNSLVR